MSSREISTMTTTTQSDLQQFHDFIAKKLQNGGAGLSPEAVLAMWRARQDSVKAIQEAIDDLTAGDEGVPLEEFMAQLCRELDERNDK